MRRAQAGRSLLLAVCLAVGSWRALPLGVVRAGEPVRYFFVPTGQTQPPTTASADQLLVGVGVDTTVCAETGYDTRAEAEAAAQAAYGQGGWIVVPAVDLPHAVPDALSELAAQQSGVSIPLPADAVDAIAADFARLCAAAS